MIAGAVRAYLMTEGFAPVRIIAQRAGLGDYVRDAGPVWGVWAEERAETARVGRKLRDTFRAGLMIRCRDDDSPMATENLRRTVDPLVMMQGQAISYTLPDGSARSYQVLGVRRVNGPVEYPHQGGGYVATSNYDLLLREV